MGVVRQPQAYRNLIRAIFEGMQAVHQPVVWARNAEQEAREVFFAVRPERDVYERWSEANINTD